MIFHERHHTPCPCGSGRDSWWAYDARGIPLARVCVICLKEKMARYRPEVLTDPSYDCDEVVEADDY